MNEKSEAIIAEFTELVRRVQQYRSLPCICDNSSVEAKEETLTNCTPCHVDSIFDETMEHARGVAEFIDGMADNHPKQPRRMKAARKSNVVKFEPLGRKSQPSAVWKG